MGFFRYAPTRIPTNWKNYYAGNAYVFGEKTKIPLVNDKQEWIKKGGWRYFWVISATACRN